MAHLLHFPRLTAGRRCRGERHPSSLWSFRELQSQLWVLMCGPWTSNIGAVGRSANSGATPRLRIRLPGCHHKTSGDSDSGLRTLHQRLKCLSAHGLREGSPPLLPSPQSLFVGLGSHTAPLQHFPLDIEKVLNNTGAALRLEKRKPGSGQLPPAQLAALSADSQLCFSLSLEWGYRRGFPSERKGTWFLTPQSRGSSGRHPKVWFHWLP